MTTKPRLGKGLDALFSEAIQLHPHHATAQSQHVAISRIQLNPYQPRKNFDEDELVQLADSIKTHGVLTPVLVRPIGAGAEPETVIAETLNVIAQMAG